MELLCTQCRRIGPHPTARGESHVFSRVLVVTWGIFSSYTRDGPSKLIFLKQHQNSSLVMRDTSGISSRLGRAIWMLLEVRWETQCAFPFSTGILGFLPIFKKSQASSPFEALNSVCLLICQRDVRPPVQMRRGPRFLSMVSTGNQTSLHLLK